LPQLNFLCTSDAGTVEVLPRKVLDGLTPKDILAETQEGVSKQQNKPWLIKFKG